MILLNEKSECEICGNSTYLRIESSILIDRYPFITKKNLVECSKCGARFIICSKCDSTFNRVHLALDIFQIKVKCSKCGKENKVLSEWVVKINNKA